jgi:4'-phosphopantetheinyl transferase
MLSATSSAAAARTPRLWTPAPSSPQASEGVVDVWRADLAAAADGLEDLLNQDECERAARIVRTSDRVRWARSRGVLRALLGRYLDRDPSRLSFVLGPQGKPALRAGTEPDVDLRFNLSHSGTLVLYAVAVGREVGINVETARRQVDEVAVAARVLGRDQALRLARPALDPQARTREFLRAWVRHEAKLKCRGSGLATPAHRSLAAELWTARLDVGARAAAAVAVEGGPRELALWEWSG